MNSEDRSSNGSSNRWLERISRMFGSEPQDKEEIYNLLKEASERELLDDDALSMMEGAMLVSERRARDVMTPRAKLEVVRAVDDLDEVLRVAIDSAHSRMPVVGEDVDEVLGMLLSKDLLPFFQKQKRDRFNIHEVMREALFVPEAMRLNQLLKNLKKSRNHMAVVVDEYGSTAGVVTLEDLLEQIVGEIEDEHDTPEQGELSPVS
ncbi:MAG: CBS domain-containing protein [Candidatus Thiodiazotropha taylori]|nr:CBS domain-containing protein [Candidatus Thiodiazotropha taylori]MCG7927126.1 CBS domain-containing protein [Candidatus Thiodiazotropha taylori]MCG7936448.1 CBS domain-containing protein [Candidatus Thiodiazotropha taylori]MCG7969873.1 CBS domain-containing protein [Candidatus Thiodiazotropha taylori]MCG8037743.1 CBS domain-containing protein [Candidatus Thiodiazotropha taylori]